MSQTKHNRRSSNKFVTLRARVDVDLKNRLTQYRKLPDVSRSEAFIVRKAVEQFLDHKAA